MRRHRHPHRVLVALSLLASGCLGGADLQAEFPDHEQAALDLARRAPHAVVALIDTGINPYHKTFRDPSPQAYLYPGKYLPGYPPDAIALELTLDADDYWRAVKEDCETAWSTIQPGQLYWFPGTKIVGAIYFPARPDLIDAPPAPTDCSTARPDVEGVLDSNGHGTMVASRAASVEYGACPQCKIVSVQGFSNAQVSWTASQSAWIDAQSNSWGPVVPLPVPSLIDEQSNLVGSPSEFAATVEAAAQRHLAFWASGNGALTRLGLVGHPTLLEPHLGPSTIPVGGHDSGYFIAWPGWSPYVVSDACNSWAARAETTDDAAEDVGGGTSGATPYAAGGAARILLEARRILGENRTGVRDGVVAEGTPSTPVSGGPLADGTFTLSEWRETLFKTASPRPQRQYEDGSVCGASDGLVLFTTGPVRWADVPPQYPEFLHIGYGSVDNASMEFASRVLLGAAPLPDRSLTDQYFATVRRARTAVQPAFTALP